MCLCLVCPLQTVLHFAEIRAEVKVFLLVRSAAERGSLCRLTEPAHAQEKNLFQNTFLHFNSSTFLMLVAEISTLNSLDDFSSFVYLGTYVCIAIYIAMYVYIYMYVHMHI